MRPTTLPIVLPQLFRELVSAVAVAALPDVFWLPAVLTPGKLMSADPLNETPPMFLAVCRVVAVVALPLRAAVIVPALKLPEPSRATIAPAVFALVAFEVTVNVELPDWLAVKVAEPDRPVPETARVNVPLLTLAAVVAVDALPFRAAVIVPAEKLPEPSRSTIWLPVFALVAVMVALLAWLVIVPAVVAVVALPLSVAVMVAALKLPEASRATTLEAVFVVVASTAHVCAPEPL